MNIILVCEGFKTYLIAIKENISEQFGYYHLSKFITNLAAKEKESSKPILSCILDRNVLQK